MSVVTLKNLKDATAQQVFDQVVNHLRKQGVASICKNTGDCLYRHGELKCAAGALIADDEYRPEMDDQDSPGTSWRSLINRGLVESTLHDTLIGDLQNLHDSNWPDNERELKFASLAKRHNVVFTAKEETL